MTPPFALLPTVLCHDLAPRPHPHRTTSQSVSKGYWTGNIAHAKHPHVSDFDASKGAVICSPPLASKCKSSLFALSDQLRNVFGCRMFSAHCSASRSSAPPAMVPAYMVVVKTQHYATCAIHAAADWLHNAYFTYFSDSCSGRCSSLIATSLPCHSAPLKVLPS